jgi:hypothetical protein
VVFRVSLLSWLRRGEFCRLHAVAARAVSDGVPRQRVCILDFVCAFWRRGNYISGGKRRAPLRVVREASGSDVDCICNWIVVDSVRGGNSREIAAELDQRSGR